MTKLKIPKYIYTGSGHDHNALYPSSDLNKVQKRDKQTNRPTDRPN